MNNSLAEVHPELISQWSEKNKIKPTEISVGSHKKAIWECEKGHSWKAKISDRIIIGEKCTVCENEYRFAFPGPTG